VPSTLSDEITGFGLAVMSFLLFKSGDVATREPSAMA